MEKSIDRSGYQSTSASSREEIFLQADSFGSREIVHGLTAQPKSDANRNSAPAKASKPQEVWIKGIKEVSRRRGHWNALLEYFDYPDEELTWTELYQVPPYQSGKSEEMRQLMLRPQYPSVLHKSKESDVSSNSDVTVIVDGSWKAGDLVDWWNSDCYWSGKVTKLLGNGKAEIELIPPPLGEGETYEVFTKDLRPSLDWSPTFGWAVPAYLDGERSRQCAELLQPVSQGNAMREGRRDSQATTGSPSNASISIHLPSNSLLDENSVIVTTEIVERPSSIVDSKAAENRSKDTSNQTTSFAASSTHKTLPAFVEKRDSKSKDLVEQTSSVADAKEAANMSKESVWSYSDPVLPIGDDELKRASPTVKDPYYSSCPLKKFKVSGEIRLNSTQCDSLEAAIMDLEELANKISWLKGLMDCGRPLSDAVRPSWKFVDHYGTSTSK